MWLVRNLWIARKLFTWHKARTSSKDKIREVEEEYTELIREFNLIQKKESKLSSTKRKEVQARVLHLVSKGHIKIE